MLQQYNIKDELFGFINLETGGDGLFQLGKDGVKEILTPHDKKVEFILFEDKTLCYVKSAMGYPAIYPVYKPKYEGNAKAILMDLDGTSVHSESFWMWIIEQTVSRLTNNAKFTLEASDEPHVSGHSVSEHLQYCIDKYCPNQTVEEARKHYFAITEYEMNEILHGRGKTDAFTPAPGLKDFLYELKAKNIKIGLVTSGLYNKAMPEIISAFKTLGMGDPLDFYDAIITAGQALVKGQVGTLGELAPKPHPWLYSETARVGLGLTEEDKGHVLGFEDSSAGVVSIRLAGFSAIGINGGNISKSGVQSLCLKEYDNLCNALPLILS
ncbi:HAD family hydrolase [Paenibacillus etheri]|uniref:Haloacid dehalogenase n=1 Tax=Paenibacillus etheri TaxID=1306852 RepID=A0A0W1ATN4_9BACL|nr:HAD family phosphatase [Paenibacillus etheri]KTD84698.1 haloacid dehalogenase [Paenibacillus etheri]